MKLKVNSVDWGSSLHEDDIPLKFEVYQVTTGQSLSLSLQWV